MWTKDEIRAAMRVRRKAMPPEERARVSKDVCRRLLDREDVRTAIAAKGPIAVYLASPDEISLTDFITDALAYGAVLVAPRWNGTAYELARLISLDSCIPGPHGILEPPSSLIPHPSSLIPHPSSLIPHPSSLIPRIWLVPGLAFTADGRRLGYGGGWYDRLLAQAGPQAVALGIAYSWQVVDGLPAERHDVRVHEVVDS